MGSIEPDFLENFSKFKVKGKLAIACSGGIDSLALTILAAKNADVTAIIIDHGLRKEAKAEAEYTKKTLDKLKIKNVILRGKGKNIKSNLQEKAREMRYKLLLDHCKKNKIKFLATAHHADDNAENFLLRLARGSGVDGLSSIPEVLEIDGIKIIRPLLPFTKAELKTYLQKQKIKWVEDPTNQTDKYKRNVLRHALAKLEDKELITSRINDAAINLARVRNFLELETDKAFKRCVALKKPVELDLKNFTKLHDEIAYRVLVQVIDKLAKPDHKPRFEKLKRLKNDLTNGKTRTLGGLIFREKNGKIIIDIEK